MSSQGTTPEPISWLKFAEQLREKYSYLLNLDLCLRIAKDAKEFVTGGSDVREE